MESIARSYYVGMGKAVADRTINRKIVREFGHLKRIDFVLPRNDERSLQDQIASEALNKGYVYSGTLDYHIEHGDDVQVVGYYWASGQRDIESWADVASRVALGNALLEPRIAAREAERQRMERHLRQASLLMSGRHLQHGDETQPSRPLELYSNCSTSATTFLLFYLLLNGSGVGRDYSDAMIVADFNHMPIVVPVIEWSHNDVKTGAVKGFLTARDAKHLYAGRTIQQFQVPDSREGWAKAIELIERMTFERRRNEVLILDFSDVRERGKPIMGMQGRPASGPGPLMSAIASIASLRDAGMAPWRAAMYADHYAAECVLVGGARRAARMATKHWTDASIMDFIALKRGGFLWSSNNSVLIDQEFRDGVLAVREALRDYSAVSAENLHKRGIVSDIEYHAWKVLNRLAEAAYHDGTGEPGIINQDRLTKNIDGLDEYVDGLFAESDRLKIDPETRPMMRKLAKTCQELGWPMIVNPCAEIVLSALGGYCVIADVVPFHAANDDDAEDAFRTATRALIRTNLMDSLYKREVARTNRIGVGITGFHEWAYSRFKFAWHDLVDEGKSKDLWLTLSRFKRAIVEEAETYSKELGVNVPHTNTTFKPAGCAALTTTVKLSEGVVSMEDLFAQHGYDRAYLEKMSAGTWLMPMVPMQVLDMDNALKDVTKLYVNGVQEVFEITFEDGTVAKLTGNHKLMTNKGWKRVDELSEDDEILQH